MCSANNNSVPPIAKIERVKIPAPLKGVDRWVVWRAGPLKPNGKFDKIPCDPATGRNSDGQAPENWLTYQAALAAYDQGKADGIGIVLSSEHTIPHSGSEFYLVALDFDNCVGSNDSLKELWLSLGKPYVEVSPSGNGIRMFALSTEQLKGGNDRAGHELYCGGRFMSVTGVEGRGTIRDATGGLVELHRQWFGPKHQALKSRLGSNLLPPPLAETELNIELVKQKLSFVSSDADYGTWRDIVWSILSTGWTCADAIAREWSMAAGDRYDAAAFDILVRSFDPERGITLGTLHHHAEQNGWTKQAALDAVNLPVADGDAATSRHRPDRRLLTAEQVKELPILPYRVRGLLPAQGIAAIYGESGSGKSFVGMDLVFSIAAGRPDWFGMAVKQAPVVYIALEGRSGVSKRIKAWEAHNKQSVATEVRFLLGDFTLLEAEGVDKLGAEIFATLGPGAVVVVDTLNQSAPGADENSSADMSKVLTNAKHLGERVQGLVLLIHHAGKDRARGMRGHSSLFAAMDGVIEVAASPAGRSWSVAKSKDDEGGMFYGFELVSYGIGFDDDGLGITSCAVGRALNAPIAKAKPLNGKHQKAAMTRLRPLLTANPRGIGHGDAVAEVAAVLACPQGRKATVAKETVDRLLINGHLFINEGVVGLR